MCNFNAPSRNLWLSHLRSVHNEDDEFNITCGINDCVNTYTRCASFVSHVYRQHREIFASALRRDHESCGSSFSVQDGKENIAIEEFELQHAVNRSRRTTKKGALFLLNLKEVRHLSESSIEHIVGETQIFKHTIGHIQAGVNDCIARSGGDPMGIPNLTQFFSKMNLDQL